MMDTWLLAQGALGGGWTCPPRSAGCRAAQAQGPAPFAPGAVAL